MIGIHPAQLKRCHKSNSKPFRAVKADAGLQEKLKTAGDADAVVAIAKFVPVLPCLAEGTEAGFEIVP